jgi:dTDP-4-dehydrorhamnose reductase
MTSLPATDLLEDQLSEPSDALVAAMGAVPGPIGILGAGGKMGLHVARMARLALDRAGRPEVPVVAVSRFSSLRAGEEFEIRGIQAVAADLLDGQALERLPDFGTVYFLAGMKFGSAENPDALRLYNEEMPARVAARYRQSTIVALSTGCVYPFVTPGSGGSTEEDPAAPQGDYALSCYGRERAFAEASAAHGTPVALLRLNYAVEYRYGVLVDIARQVLEGRPVDVTMGYVNVIWQRDAVEHVLRAESVAASPARILNIAGTPIVAVRELAAQFGELLRKPAVITGTEEPTAWLNDASRAHRLFGTPPTPLDEMIRRVAAWVRAGGTTHGKPTKFQVRDGKF